MIDWLEFPSSEIVASAKFDTEARELSVRFKRGAEVTWRGVDRLVWDDFSCTPSPGGFISRHLRGRYAVKA